MKMTEEMYEKIAHLFPKQKSPPKISNLKVPNAILKILEMELKKNRANKRLEKLKVDSTQKYI